MIDRMMASEVAATVTVVTKSIPAAPPPGWPVRTTPQLQHRRHPNADTDVCTPRRRSSLSPARTPTAKIDCRLPRHQCWKTAPHGHRRSPAPRHWSTRPPGLTPPGLVTRGRRAPTHWDARRRPVCHQWLTPTSTAPHQRRAVNRCHPTAATMPGLPGQRGRSRVPVWHNVVGFLSSAGRNNFSGRPTVTPRPDNDHMRAGD